MTVLKLGREMAKEVDRVADRIADALSVPLRQYAAAFERRRGRDGAARRANAPARREQSRGVD